MTQKITRRIDLYTRITKNVKHEHRGFLLNKTPSECWIWQGADSGKGTGAGRGYGRISINGQNVGVHRVMFTHVYGFIPYNKHVDHLCNNRMCCNPDHLELVTPKENQKRRSARMKGYK